MSLYCEHDPRHIEATMDCNGASPDWLRPQLAASHERFGQASKLMAEYELALLALIPEAMSADESNKLLTSPGWAMATVNAAKAREAASQERVRVQGRGEELLRELVSDGPFQNDDGECSFCGFAPNDSWDLENLIAHNENCVWRRAKEHLSSPAPSAPKDEGEPEIDCGPWDWLRFRLSVEDFQRLAYQHNSCVIRNRKEVREEKVCPRCHGLRRLSDAAIKFPETFYDCPDCQPTPKAGG